jgi:hypothetical protein
MTFYLVEFLYPISKNKKQTNISMSDNSAINSNVLHSKLPVIHTGKDFQLNFIGFNKRTTILRCVGIFLLYQYLTSFIYN